MKTRPSAGGAASTAPRRTAPTSAPKSMCPAALGGKDQQPATYSPQNRPVLCADQPRLHGLRAVRGRLQRGTALCRRDAIDVPGTERPWRHGQLHRLGCAPRARSSGPSRSASRSGAARWPPPATSTSTARWKAISRRSTPRRQAAVEVQDAVRHHRQRQHLAPGASSTSACSRASAAGPASVMAAGLNDETRGPGRRRCL